MTIEEEVRTLIKAMSKATMDVEEIRMGFIDFSRWVREKNREEGVVMKIRTVEDLVIDGIPINVTSHNDPLKVVLKNG